MTAAAPVHVAVELEATGDPISGTLRHAAGPPVAFTGWLELMSGFETIREQALRSAHPPDEPAAG